MHICFITSEFPKEGFPHGGVGTFVQTLSEKLIEKGVHVSVVGLNYTLLNEFEIHKGIEIHRMKPSTIKGFGWYFNSKAIGKKIDEIHNKKPIHIIESAELGLAFITKIKTCRYVIRLHGGHHFFAEAEQREINWWKGFQEKRSFKKADAFIAVSKYVKNHTATYLSYHNKPIEVIYNPLDTNKFAPLPVTIDMNSIVFAGTVCEKKGIRQLIAAFGVVKATFPEVILNVYGRDWKFPDGSSYITMLQEKELPKIKPFDSDVVFHGSVDNALLPQIYANASVCVFPSHMETLGLVAPEAMATEKAVIFSNTGPGPEVITHQETGFLCNPFDPEDIAKNISEVLSHSNKAKEIGKAARIAVINQFGVDKIVQENIDFYTAILHH